MRNLYKESTKKLIFKMKKEQQLENSIFKKDRSWSVTDFVFCGAVKLYLKKLANGIEVPFYKLKIEAGAFHLYSI